MQRRSKSLTSHSSLSLKTFARILLSSKKWVEQSVAMTWIFGYIEIRKMLNLQDQNRLTLPCYKFHSIPIRND